MTVNGTFLADNASVLKLAVIGGNGLIGRHLLSACRKYYPDSVGTCFRHKQADLEPFDLYHPRIDTLRLVEREHAAVVITAAQTRVDACEEDPVGTRRLNVEGVLTVARQWARQGLKVVIFSSDWVFDGVAGWYDDADPPSPINEYGRQKAELEQDMLMDIPDGLVIRLGKVIGTEKGDGTVLDEMAEILSQGKEVRAAYDQHFCPTLVNDVVAGVFMLLARGTRGVVNFCNPESWVRYDLALAVAEQMGADPRLVRRVSLDDIPMKAARPKNTTMTCRRLQAEGGMAFASMRECIGHVAAHWRVGGECD